MDISKYLSSKSFFRLFFLLIIISISIIATLYGIPPESSSIDLQLIEVFPDIKIERPVDFIFLSDTSDRIFIVSQLGKVIIIENSTNGYRSEVFLDLSDNVTTSGEMGLLGMDFHPKFNENGYFFVYYNQIGTGTSKVVRFQVSETNQNKANLSTQLVIVEQQQPFVNHNGGQVRFGPDGYLYISLGDGGSANDPLGSGQDRSTVLGSILRINVSHSTINNPYTIPEDNPFANNLSGFRKEIYAYGLRNPWRFSFDPLTGTLWTGDVGQNDIEEIDIIVNGGNYGWNIKEGDRCFSPPVDCNSTDLIDPIHQYPRPDGFSITGGYVYRGNNIPDLNGTYIYGDFISGNIWGFTLNSQGQNENSLLFETNINISSFGIDKNNEIYVLDLLGSIYRINGAK